MTREEMMDNLGNNLVKIEYTLIPHNTMFTILSTNKKVSRETSN